MTCSTCDYDRDPWSRRFFWQQDVRRVRKRSLYLLTRTTCDNVYLFANYFLETRVIRVQPIAKLWKPRPMTANADPPSDNPGLAAQMRPALVKYFKRKSGSAVEAEDLTQDVLVRALTHAHWKTPSEAKGYIFRTAVNRWRDRHRRKETHGVSVPLDEEELEEVGTQNAPE